MSKIRQHRYAVNMSLQYLKKTPLLSFFIVFFISLVLMLPAFIFLFAFPSQNFEGYFQNNFQITVYLKKDLKSAETAMLINQLKQNKEIHEIKTITPEEGLKELVQSANLNDINQYINENPLPTVVIVIPKLLTSQRLNQLTAQLKHFPQIDTVVSDKQWLQQFYLLRNILAHVFVMISITLLLGIVISMIVCLHLLRQNFQVEIATYRILGATNAFLRRPIIYLGSLLGLTGGFTAVIISFFLFKWLRPSLEALIHTIAFQKVALPEISLLNLFTFLMTSLAIGWATAVIYLILNRNNNKETLALSAKEC